MWKAYNVPLERRAVTGEYVPQYIADMNCKFRMTKQYGRTSCDVEADVDNLQALSLSLAVGVVLLLAQVLNPSPKL